MWYRLECERDGCPIKFTVDAAPDADNLPEYCGSTCMDLAESD